MGAGVSNRRIPSHNRFFLFMPAFHSVFLWISDLGCSYLFLASERLVLYLTWPKLLIVSEALHYPGQVLVVVLRTVHSGGGPNRTGYIGSSMMSVKDGNSVQNLLLFLSCHSSNGVSSPGQPIALWPFSRLKLILISLSSRDEISPWQNGLDRNDRNGHFLSFAVF